MCNIMDSAVFSPQLVKAVGYIKDSAVSGPGEWANQRQTRGPARRSERAEI